MDREQKKAYAARIAQANRTELVVVIYDLMTDSIRDAQKALQKEQWDEAKTELQRAQGLLVELRGSLDRQYEISGKLASLYRYVNEQLVQSLVKRKDVNLHACLRVIQGLQSCFTEVAKQDHSAPVMETSSQVYAGLTYTKGNLNEIAVDVKSQGQDYRV